MLHDGTECGGDGQTLQPGPQLVTVSGLQVVAPLHAFVPAAQTQAPTPSNTNPGSHVKEQACCVASGFVTSQNTLAFGIAWHALHAGPQWVVSSAKQEFVLAQ